MSLGAEPSPGGGVEFVVHAPSSRKVDVVVDGKAKRMDRVADGLHVAAVDEARVGSRYGFRLDGTEQLLPDLASRHQPDGPCGLSAVVDPDGYRWADQGWQGVRHKGLVLQEIHIGTFTPQGTYRAAAEKLPLLKDVGINGLELLPVNDFPGRFGWGYDGVGWFAPSCRYGTPDDLKAFVDKAHALGIAVLLDVVYNHLGPEGEYHHAYCDEYFSKTHKNEWGDPLNFDADGGEGMRRLVVENAAYWIREFHFDGLRFDATQQIFDKTVPHVVAEAAEAARAAAGDRQLFLVAENTPQDTRILQAGDRTGGMSLDGMWNEDLQRSARILVTGQREGYYRDLEGTAAEIMRSAARGFLYQGQRSGWERQPRGGPMTGVAAERIVAYLENHDQVANSLRGQRLAELGDGPLLRAVTTVLLLGPQTPMLFQGQEWGSRSRFTYFSNLSEGLADGVWNGRQAFLAQFPSVAADMILDPCSERTFAACKLDWAERDRNGHWLALTRDLISLRRNDPVIARQAFSDLETAVPWPDLAAIRYEAPEGVRLLVLNTGVDRYAATVPDPMFADPAGTGWRLAFTSDALAYGGRGEMPAFHDEGWTFPGRSAVLLAANA